MIALAIAFGLGVLSGSEQRHQPTEAQQQEYAAAKARYAEAVAGTLADPQSNYAAYPDQYSSKCYNAQDHDTADLCAQWRAAIAAERAAKWAQASFWLGLISSLLSAIGLGCLLLSLRQTEKSLRQARKANKIARDSAYQQARPYVIFEGFNFGFHLNDGKLSEVIASFSVHNAGTTPASITDAYINLYEAPAGSPPPLDNLAPAPERTFNVTIAAKSESFGKRGITREQIIRQIDNGSRLILVAYIRYKDLAGNAYEVTRATDFMCKVDPRVFENAGQDWGALVANNKSIPGAIVQAATIPDFGRYT